MRYLSVCSGIEAASVAWHSLGWTPVAFSEIEPFPSAVLAHHYPHVQNWGDMTKFKEWPDADVDVLVGGTPCQSFSVAGLRKGMADPRGNLALTFLAIADRYRPEWLVWENVPGVLSSNGGRDFGSILGGMVELGYGVCYRVLDAQYFGVAQRRRRVFVVGHLGDWRRAAAVLLEPESLRGDSAPRREAGERVAPSLAGGTGGGCGHQYRQRGNEDAVIGAGECVSRGMFWNGEQVTQTLDAVLAKGQTMPEKNRFPAVLVPGGAQTFAADDYKTGSFEQTDVARGLTTTADRTRGAPIVAIQNATRGKDQNGLGISEAGDPMYTLDGASQHAIAFSAKDHGADAGEIASALRSMNHDGSHANGGGQVAVAFHNRQDPDVSGDVTHPLGAKDNGLGLAVRRLTPRECERLQGFPDDYTLIPVRGKSAKDGPRYRALGNSMAVPVMRWIGKRIDEAVATAGASCTPR